MNFNNININDIDKNTFGKCIKERREELGISLRSVAKECNVSAAYFSDIEKGFRKCPRIEKKPDFIENLIKVLKVSEYELDSFYDMAFATRGYYESLKNYIDNNRNVRIALRLTQEMNVSDEFWNEVIEQLKQMNKEEQKTRKLTPKQSN